jgi:hypothetical protein
MDAMPATLRTPDTVVVCRPSQLHEAAVVLSCFPAENQPVLFVLEPPPCTEAKYKALHESYRTMRNLRDEALGSRRSRLEVRHKGTATEWSNEEIDRRAEALTPFRQWVKRNRLLGELLKGLPLRRSVFLFGATERDMSMFDAVPTGSIRDDRFPFLPQGITWLTLLSKKPGLELTRDAWRLVRGEEPFPTATVSSASDCVAVVTGLIAALSAHVPLVIDDHASSTSPARESDGHASEAVLVEATDDAAKLVAVQYCIRQGARLCVYAAPDIGPIENSRQRVQDWQEGRISADPSALLQEIEDAVSALVPSRIVEAVGNLPLTAFTVGVPYHFLRKGKADWSSKPIGLMAGDELILASMELYRPSVTNGPRFNILFDPGYFNPRETDGVLRELRSISAFPLLLQRAAASSTSLMALAGAPVDLMYFNTHGSATAIQLRDIPLPGYKLLQRLTFFKHPTIFNNACLSWTGVGGHFIAAGASSYIGTLWSVNADQAATYAIAVVNRIIHGESPIAASMHSTGADPITENAYVFIGPVGKRLRKYDSPARGEQENMYDVASSLLQLATWVATSGPPPDSPMTWPTIACLLGNAHGLCDELDRRAPEPSIARVGLLSDQLQLGNHLYFDQATRNFYANLSMRGLNMLDKIAWKTSDDLKVKARFRQVCSRIARKMGQLKPAADLLIASVDELEQKGLTAGSEYLDLCDTFKEMGEYDQALESALRAKEAYEKPQEGAEAARGMMLACGRLAQLLRRANKLDEAWAAADQGYIAAERANDIQEQAIFKMDQSRIHMVRQDYKSAVLCAEEGLKKALWSHNDDLQVNAQGTLALALIFAGDLRKAKKHAIEGRDLALERDIPSEIANFQMDLSDIERQSGDPQASLASLREAAHCLAIVGNEEQIKRALGKSESLLSQLDSWDALTDVALLATAVLLPLQRSDRSMVCTFMVHSILRRIKNAGWQESRDGLWRLRADLQEAVAGRPDPVPEQVTFLLDLLQACLDYSKGNSKDALAAMQRLDALSANGFQLVAFLAKGAKD